VTFDRTFDRTFDPTPFEGLEQAARQAAFDGPVLEF
jgi:hypothetical protein